MNEARFEIKPLWFPVIEIAPEPKDVPGATLGINEKFAAATKKGDLVSAKTLYAFEQACLAAASKGHTGVPLRPVKKTKTEPLSCDARARCCFAAARNGQLEAFKCAVSDAWPYYESSGQTRSQCLKIAKTSGWNDIVEWITGPDSPDIEEVD